METTDDLSEVFDVVDREDKVVGKATRGQVHSDPKLIHRSTVIFVINNNDKIFLQRRSLTKDTDSLKWTISCSGHVPSGETYEMTAKRELEEELGIKDVSLFYLCKYLYSAGKESEITVLYKTNYDGVITLKSDEILEGKFFSRDEIIIAAKTGEIELNLYGKIALGRLGILKGI